MPNPLPLPYILDSVLSHILLAYSPFTNKIPSLLACASRKADQLGQAWILLGRNIRDEASQAVIEQRIRFNYLRRWLSVKTPATAAACDAYGLSSGDADRLKSHHRQLLQGHPNYKVAGKNDAKWGNLCEDGRW